jgi:DNA helicase IV
VPSELEREQDVVTGLYARLDELESQTERSLDRVVKGPTAGTPAAQGEREAYIRLYRQRLTALSAAQERLCFGRLDLLAGEGRYLGRLGMSDENQQPVLTDWRAPAAEPFYQATAASPMGVVRRRHIVTQGRAVTSLEDDILDLDAFDGDVAQVQGGGALMAALGAKRTGRMGDIVATIQSEQDRIIRSPLQGVLVVEGGPGCGKTVVALHRAAYLLYTHRDRLASRGVLIVGPNRVFLRYIEQVLPALGETSAVLVTPGQLLPGVEATADEDEAVAALKGDLRMVDVIANAVRSRQRIPSSPRTMEVHGTSITLTPAMVEAARSRARSSRKPHNGARRIFVLDLLDRLATSLARARGVDLSSQRDLLIADLRDSGDVRREINLCWMPFTPGQLLGQLYASPRRLTEAAPKFSDRERGLLSRPNGSAWTNADIPLLDEAAELLGEDDEEQLLVEARRNRDRAREESYARDVLEMTGQSGITADQLMERYGPESSRMTVAEHAMTDRTWAFGHVVVDEAQELSPMAWRVLFRRCPSKSMTVVGDLDQTSSLAGISAWSDIFDRFSAGKWRSEQLTVNYRTPAPVMELAGALLRAHGREPKVSASAREGEAPVFRRVGHQDRTALIQIVEAELARQPGRLCVIAPRAQREWARAVLSESLEPGRLGEGVGALDAQVSIMSATQAKGLEFDCVVMLEPTAILNESVRGPRDLYVALTRPTSRLVVAHSESLPPGMSPPD